MAAGITGVREDSSLLSRLDRMLLAVESRLALISGIAVFSLMVLAVISVGGRYFFNMPLPGYVDWIEQVMPFIAFFGIAYVQRNGGHIRMDMVVGQLRGRVLWAAEFITTLAMLILMVLLVWGSFSHFLRSFDFAAPLWSRDSTIDISIPLWPTKLLVAIAFFTICLRLALHLWGYGAAFLSGTKSPVAVPLIQGVAAQAVQEAELMLEPGEKN